MTIRDILERSRQRHFEQARDYAEKGLYQMAADRQNAALVITSVIVELLKEAGDKIDEEITTKSL